MVYLLQKISQLIEDLIAKISYCIDKRVSAV